MSCVTPAFTPQGHARLGVRALRLHGQPRLVIWVPSYKQWPPDHTLLFLAFSLSVYPGDLLAFLGSAWRESSTALPWVEVLAFVWKWWESELLWGPNSWVQSPALRRLAEWPGASSSSL